MLSDSTGDTTDPSLIVEKSLQIVNRNDNRSASRCYAKCPDQPDEPPDRTSYQPGARRFGYAPSLRFGYAPARA